MQKHSAISIQEVVQDGEGEAKAGTIYPSKRRTPCQVRR